MDKNNSRKLMKDGKRSELLKRPEIVNLQKKVYKASELYKLDIPEDLKLWGDFIQRSTLSALIGGSDTGKSTLLRQLAIAIAVGEDMFLNAPLTIKFQKVLIVSIEDGVFHVAKVFKENYKELVNEPLDGLKFLFGFEESALKEIKAELEKEPYDAIFIDCYSDVYTGRSGNDQMETKKFLKTYDDLAKANHVAICFLHHLNKAADEARVNKSDASGSSAFEQKMRSIISLTKDGYKNTRRYLKIVKGNYAPTEAKRVRHILNFDETKLQFEYLGSEGIEFIEDDITEEKKLEIVAFLLDHSVHIRGEGMTYEEAKAAVQSEFGIKRSSGALSNWVKKYRQLIPPAEEYEQNREE